MLSDKKNADLTDAIRQRSIDALNKFRQQSSLGISYPKALSMLAEVNEYWNDMLRPALGSLACEAVGGQPESIGDISVMVTLLAAGLGVHDDIIDKSTNKHFRMTIFGLHGLEDSLLLGDLFIVKALTTARELLKKGCSQDKFTYILEAFEKFFLEVWQGELIEIDCRRNINTQIDTYIKCLWMSTADSEACAKFGAILGNGSEKEIQALADFGRRLGFVYRLTDEIKDTLNLEGNLAHRLEFESVPLPILYAAKHSKKAQLTINQILQKSKIEPDDIVDSIRCCNETKAFNYVSVIAKETTNQAFESLRILKPSTSQKILQLMIEKALVNFNDIA